MMTNLISVPFHAQNLTAALIDGVPHVAMRPICENIGLDWDSQKKRINRHPVLNSIKVMMTSVAADGKKRQMLMMPIEYLNGWLFGVDIGRVKESIKEKLIEYQKECFTALANHFIPKTTALPEPPTITTAQQGELYNRVNNKALSSGKNNAYYWSRFQNHFKINSYKNLVAEQFGEALDYLDKLEGDGEGAFLVLTQEELAGIIKSNVSEQPGAIPLHFDGHIRQRYLLAAEGDGTALVKPIDENAFILNPEQIVAHIGEITKGKYRLVPGEIYKNLVGLGEKILEQESKKH